MTIALLTKSRLRIGAGFFYYKSAKPSAFELQAPRGIQAKEGPVNINTASVKELMSLKRIGPVLAERIVAYREENGPFRTKEDIKRVKGIGEHTYSLIEERLTLE